MLVFAILQNASLDGQMNCSATKRQYSNSPPLETSFCCRLRANFCLGKELLSILVAANLGRHLQLFSSNNAGTGMPSAKISSPCTQAVGRVHFLAI